MIKEIVKKNFVKFLSIVLLIFIFCGTSTILTFADTGENANLQNKLEKQEEELKNDIGDVNHRDDNLINDGVNSITHSEYGEFNASKKSEELGGVLKTILIKSRTTVIVGYALYVAVISIYIATIGSRGMNRKRNGLLLLRGNTIVFLLFINAPIAIIYFSALKNNISKISISNMLFGGIQFFQSNSFIIFALLAYLGISKIIISKNNLPIRIQGKYLVKASFILLIVLNILPLCISFIITP